MGNQNCVENCKGFSLNEKIIEQMSSEITKSKLKEVPEELKKVKSSKPGNWEKKSI